MTVLRIVEEGLRRVVLSPLIRPAVGPDDEPTEELAAWATTMYAYSAIAHMRTILAGLVVLADLGNAPSADVLCRHVFEWAAHACFMDRNLRKHLAGKNWGLAFKLSLQADGGNLWLKRHGHKYEESPFPGKIPDPIRMGKLIAAYTQYQIEEYGQSDAEDAYGFLSEHSHPNGACFLQYREISGREMRFIRPPASPSFHSLERSLIEWLRFVYGLLGSAKEDSVRLGILAILTEIARPLKDERRKAD